MNQRKRAWKPSAAGIEMLENVAKGLQTTAGLRGRSAHGGAQWTARALHQHGLLDSQGVTAEGYAAIARAARKVEP